MSMVIFAFVYGVGYWKRDREVSRVGSYIFGEIEVWCVKLCLYVYAGYSLACVLPSLGVRPSLQQSLVASFSSLASFSCSMGWVMVYVDSRCSKDQAVLSVGSLVHDGSYLIILRGGGGLNMLDQFSTKVGGRSTVRVLFPLCTSPRFMQIFLYIYFEYTPFIPYFFCVFCVGTIYGAVGFYVG